MWELDCEESWAPKNWCFWSVVLEKTLESPLDCKEIQPVHSEGDQSWVFFGRTDAKAETPILWPPDAKSWLIGKDPDAGRDWRQEEKGTTEDEMDGWHHGLNGHEFEWTPGVGDGPGGMACWDSRGRKESDTTERLNWTELNWGFWWVYFIEPSFHGWSEAIELGEWGNAHFILLHDTELMLVFVLFCFVLFFTFSFSNLGCLPFTGFLQSQGWVQFIQFSCSVMFDSLQPHGL